VDALFGSKLPDIPKRPKAAKIWLAALFWAGIRRHTREPPPRVAGLV